MYNECHMLDTNMILAMILPSDSSFDIAKEYFKEEFFRYISNTACEESEKKIFDIKQMALSISEYVKKFSLDNSVNYLNLDKIIFSIKKSFLEEFKNNQFPINVPKTRFEQMVDDFFNTFDNELKNILISSENDFLNYNVRKAFKKNNIALNNFLEGYNCITIKSSDAEVKYLKGLGLDKKDSILINEAESLHLTLKSDISFVTFDKNILDLKDVLLHEFSKNVVVSHPIEFVSVNN